MTQLIRQSQKNKLLVKIQRDLQYGVKIFGDYRHPSDKIRVWTKLDSITFGVIANSSKRFGIGLNSIEIQSFENGGGMKVKVLLRKSDSDNPDIELIFSRLTPTFVEQRDGISEYEKVMFINQYMESRPSVSLTKESFERNYYPKDKYEFVNPSLFLKERVS